MKEFIQQMYQAILEENVERFDDIEDRIKGGDIELSTEDIVPLCELFMTDYEYMEYYQTIEIARMTLWAVEKKNIKEGFEELARGWQEIYNEREKYTRTNCHGSIYEDFIDRYIGMIILRYKEEDMVLFGETISKNCSTDCKSAILKILKGTIAWNEETEGIITKGKILENNIKL